MEVFACTDIGKEREKNQDYYFISEVEPFLFILADGMGGYAGGEIASKLSVETVRKYVNNNWENLKKDKNNILQFLKNATQYANMIVYEKSQHEKGLEEMGTTLEICLIYQEIAYISHIGDSRIYLVNNEEITSITTDHSYVEKLVEDGTITRQEAEHHPKKHMLMKALGCTAYVEPDLLEKKIKLNDNILICSDGLTNMVDEETIQKVILNNINMPDKELIKLANEYGGKDNITVIIIKNKENSYNE